MDDFFMEHEDYLKKREEYLLNRKPERYKLHIFGWDGFILHDTIKAFNNERKHSYLFAPDYKGGIHEDSRHFNIYDLVDELNRLDFQVNGGLYDDYYHILSNKDRIHNHICSRLDEILNNLVTNDSFTLNVCNYMTDNLENVKIEVKVSRDGLEDIDTGHPILDAILNNRFLNVLDEYIGELDGSDNRDDVLRADVLIELKMRLLESLMD